MVFDAIFNQQLVVTRYFTKTQLKTQLKTCSITNLLFLLYIQRTLGNIDVHFICVFQFFDMRMLFLLTALCADTRYDNIFKKYEKKKNSDKLLCVLLTLLWHW